MGPCVEPHQAALGKTKGFRPARTEPRYVRIQQHHLTRRRIARFVSPAYLRTGFRREFRQASIGRTYDQRGAQIAHPGSPVVPCGIVRTLNIDVGIDRAVVYIAASNGGEAKLLGLLTAKFGLVRVSSRPLQRRQISIIPQSFQVGITPWRFHRTGCCLRVVGQ